MISEMLTWTTALPLFLITIAIFGFAPPFVLRFVLLLFPKGDLRRRELMAELRALPRRDRPIFVVEQIETGLMEGLPARWIAIRGRLRKKRTELVLHSGLAGHGELFTVSGVALGDSLTIDGSTITGLRPNCSNTVFLQRDSAGRLRQISGESIAAWFLPTDSSDE